MMDAILASGKEYVAILAAIIGLLKFGPEFMAQSHKFKFERYKFLQEYLRDLSDKSTHPLLLETGFFSLFGKYNNQEFGSEFIKSILADPRPSRSIRDFRLGHRHIQYDSYSRTFSWRTQWLGSKKRRKITKVIYATLYILSLLISYQFLMSGDFTSTSNTIISIFTILTFAWLAYTFLNAYASIKAAQRFAGDKVH